MNDLTIGKFAAAGNVGVETVRFYQRKGLLATPKRLDGIRRYGAGDVEPRQRDFRWRRSASCSRSIQPKIAPPRANWRKGGWLSWTRGWWSSKRPGHRCRRSYPNAHRERRGRAPS
jgi:hypothetical protein